MTDAEIIKAIEICAQNSVTRHNGLTYQGMPLHFLFEEILGFVNRQNSNIEELKSKNSNLISDLSSSKAEIERLTAESQMVDGYADALEELSKAEAVKEFAERLKAEVDGWYYDLTDLGDTIDALADIDNLVKEFTEGSDNDGGS